MVTELIIYSLGPLHFFASNQLKPLYVVFFLNCTDVVVLLRAQFLMKCVLLLTDNLLIHILKFQKNQRK